MSVESDAEKERAAERAAIARGERARPGQAKLEEAERQRAQPSNETTASEAPASAASSSSSDGASFGSFWTVAALAVLLIGAAIVLGHWSSGLWISVLALLLVGALWPPLGILIGGVALFSVFFLHHAELIQHITTGGQTA